MEYRENPFTAWIKAEQAMRIGPDDCLKSQFLKRCIESKIFSIVLPLRKVHMTVSFNKMWKYSAFESEILASAFLFR